MWIRVISLERRNGLSPTFYERLDRSAQLEIVTMIFTEETRDYELLIRDWQKLLDFTWDEPASGYNHDLSFLATMHYR